MSVPVHTGFLKTMWLLEITVALFFRGEQLRNQSLSHHKGTRKHASLLPPQGQTCKTLLSSVWLVPHIKSNHYDAPKVSVLSPLETKKKKKLCHYFGFAAMPSSWKLLGCCCWSWSASAPWSSKSAASGIGFPLPKSAPNGPSSSWSSAASSFLTTALP